MSELLEDIRKYWTKRAKGYSEYNRESFPENKGKNGGRQSLRNFRTNPLRRSIFWMWEPARAFLLSFWRRQGFR